MVHPIHKQTNENKGKRTQPKQRITHAQHCKLLYQLSLRTIQLYKKGNSKYFFRPRVFLFFRSYLRKEKRWKINTAATPINK